MDVEEWIIREAEIGDETSLQVNCKTGASVAQVRDQVEWTTRERGYPRLVHFVAVHGADIVGNVMLTPFGGHAVTAPNGLTLCAGPQGARPVTGNLGDWVVAHTHWQRGIGSALARRVIEEARAWQLRRVICETTNPAAVRSLQSVGFTICGELPLFDGPLWHSGNSVVALFVDL